MSDSRPVISVRAKDRADYEAMHKDYSESIDAIERAIAVLKKETADVPQAALLQLKTLSKHMSLIPEDAQKAINTFLQQDPAQVEENLEAGLVAGPPEANAYEFQSGGIIEMLEKLLDKFMDKRTTLEKEEMSSKSAFDVMVIDLKGQIKQAEQDLAEKKKTEGRQTCGESRQGGRAYGDYSDPERGQKVSRRRQGGVRAKGFGLRGQAGAPRSRNRDARKGYRDHWQRGCSWSSRKAPADPDAVEGHIAGATPRCQLQSRAG